MYTAIRYARTLWCGLAIVLSTTALTSEAEAQRAHHARVKISPINRGGRVVGARISAELHAEMSYTSARVGLGRVTPRPTDDHRIAGTDPSAGHLLIQFPQVDGIQVGQPHKFKQEIIYGDGNTLQGGEEVELISSWPGDYNHMWGMQEGNATRETYRLPAATGAANATRGRRAAAADDNGS